jgi:hypothetical protein
MLLQGEDWNRLNHTPPKPVPNLRWDQSHSSTRTRVKEVARGQGFQFRAELSKCGPKLPFMNPQSKTIFIPILKWFLFFFRLTLSPVYGGIFQRIQDMQYDNTMAYRGQGGCSCIPLSQTLRSLQTFKQGYIFCWFSLIWKYIGFFVCSFFEEKKGGDRLTLSFWINK